MNWEGQRPGDILFAIPKKGRLHEKVVKLLEGAGIKFNRTPRLDLAACPDLPLTIVFLPAADIAKYVGQGSVHMGITGQDMISESRVDVTQISQLGFGFCKLAVQAPIANGVKDPKDLCGGRIVTSFPNLAADFFKKLDPSKETTINYVSGSVEVACALGLADAIVDLVETGSTMRAAGLELVDTIMTTEAVLISNPKLSPTPTSIKIEKRIQGAVLASKKSMITYNIPRELLNEAKKVTPGNKAPTISPLEEPGWIAVSALVLKAKAVDIMDDLEALGAQDILLTDLANCRV